MKFRVFLPAAGLGLLLAACAYQPPGPGGVSSADRAAYDRSIAATAVFRKDAVLPLTPLKYPVQAASLTNYPGWAEGKEGQTLTMQRDNWITVEPELQTLCKGIASERVVDKLHKILGLPPATPDDAEAKFVLMTIDKPQPVGPSGQGVFRPCADPYPGATQCGNTLAGPPAYAKWLAGVMLKSYKLDSDIAETGYPWTRLGYTYNWDPQAASPRGPQEYVVPRGTVVHIRKIVPAREYCK